MDQEERDLLIETNTLVKEVHRAVYGNGREGLLERVAVVEKQHEALRRDMDERTPTRRQKNTLVASGAAGVLALVSWLVTEVFPRLKG